MRKKFNHDTAVWCRVLRPDITAGGSFFLVMALFVITAFKPATRTPTCTIAEEATRFTTDNLGNVYLVKAESIRKFDPHCAFQKAFSNKNFGPITSVDATNALRIVLFYRDFNRVVFLDNTMSQNGGPVQLEALGFPTATLVASSHDNGLWLYDQQNFELVRLDQNLQVEQRTGNLSQLLGIDSLQPNFLLEKDNRLFLNNPSTGVLVFDIFGTYSKTMPVTGLHSLQVVDNNIVYFQNGSLNSVHLLSNETTLYEEPVDTVALDMRIESKAVFVLNKEKVLSYEINK